MARCGIRLRYPVSILPVDDNGLEGNTLQIGDAETLSEAINLAERQGFCVRDDSDGGHCRLVQTGEEARLGFIVTVYSDMNTTPRKYLC